MPTEGQKGGDQPSLPKKGVQTLSPSLTLATNKPLRVVEVRYVFPSETSKAGLHRTTQDSTVSFCRALLAWFSLNTNHAHTDIDKGTL